MQFFQPSLKTMIVPFFIAERHLFFAVINKNALNKDMSCFTRKILLLLLLLLFLYLSVSRQESFL